MPRSTQVSHAHAVGQRDVGEQAGARLEIARRVLGVDAHLDRVRRAAGGDVVERQRLAGREPHHPLDEVDAGDLLGDAVLDLQARVDLEEVERRRVVGIETNSTVPAER